MTVQRILYLNTTACRLTPGTAARRAGRSVRGDAEDQGGSRPSAPPLAPPLRLLCNVAEESHQVETIPSSAAPTGNSCSNARRGQLFFGTALTASTSPGLRKDRRKNERVLVSALTNPFTCNRG